MYRKFHKVRPFRLPSKLNKAKRKLGENRGRKAIGSKKL